MGSPIITPQVAEVRNATAQPEQSIFYIVSTVAVATTDVKHHILLTYKNGVPTSKIKPLRLSSVPSDLKSHLGPPVLHTTLLTNGPHATHYHQSNKQT
jgi:hypothetical protein